MTWKEAWKAAAPIRAQVRRASWAPEHPTLTFNHTRGFVCWTDGTRYVPPFPDDGPVATDWEVAPS